MARNYSNTAPPVSLTVAATTTSTTLTVASTTGYPAAPFLLGLERGTANEEVVLCTATTATTFTVTRAYDGTSGKAHAIGTSVEHTVAAIDYREATGPRTIRVPHTFAIPGDILVPSGDIGVIPGFYVPVPASQTVTLVGGRARIAAGTSATFSIRANDTDITGVTGIVAVPGGVAIPNPSYAPANDTRINPVVTAVSGAPKNMSITLYFDYTSII